MEREMVDSHETSSSRRQFMQAAAAIMLQPTLAATARAAEHIPGIATNADVL